MAGRRTVGGELKYMYYFTIKMLLKLFQQNICVVEDLFVYINILCLSKSLILNEWALCVFVTSHGLGYTLMAVRIFIPDCTSTVFLYKYTRLL